MKPNITVQQVQSVQRSAELQIAKILNLFHNYTGFSINKLDFEVIERIDGSKTYFVNMESYID
jgi:hypothetical protein